MINKKIIIFFYVNDIVICYKKNKTKIRIIISELQIKYVINILKNFFFEKMKHLSNYNE